MESLLTRELKKIERNSHRNCSIRKVVLEKLVWGRKLPVEFSAEKIQLVSYERSNNTGAIDKKMDGSVLEEKSYFKMLWLTFSSKLD